MFFQLKWSFSVAFNFGPAGDDGVRKDIQLQRASRTQPQKPSNPSRPKLHKFGRFQPTSMPTTVIDPIAETESAKAKDRESLKLLLQATNQAKRSARAAEHNKTMSSGSIVDSLVQSITLEDPFVSDSPLSLPSDSGSDLVSSLQRLRVRGLASYFEMERTSAPRPSSSSATLMGEGVEKGVFGNIVDGSDEIEKVEGYDWEDVEDGDWEMMTMSDAS